MNKTILALVAVTAAMAAVNYLNRRMSEPDLPFYDEIRGDLHDV